LADKLIKLETKGEIPSRVYYELPNDWNELSEIQRESWIKNVHSDLLSKMNQNFEISLKGSSLIGFSYDKESFSKVVDFLNELNKKGRLRCRENWCRICTLYKEDPKQGVVGHVFKISKAQAIKIESFGSFTWKWERPESDFAKSKGNPADFWERIKSSKTQPIFYTRIFSEDEALRRLGMKP
jgi:hypothetical protein